MSKNTPSEQLRKLKELFVDYGVEPHWCGAKECEASIQTGLFFTALQSFITQELKEAERVARSRTLTDITIWANNEMANDYVALTPTNKKEIAE